MFIGIDMGNTQLRAGFFDDTASVPFSIHRIPTPRDMRAPELAETFASWSMRQKPLGAIVCSVVPECDPMLAELLSTITNTTPIFVNHTSNHGLVIRYDDPAKLGADRIINCAAAAALGGQDVIIADIGTALTLDLLSDGKVFDGGVIVPGPGSALRSLGAAASQLFEVAVTPPPLVHCYNTADALASGVTYGWAALIEGLVARIEKECGKSFSLVLTGGAAEAISRCMIRSHTLDPMLTMKGLAAIWHRTVK